VKSGCAALAAALAIFALPGTLEAQPRVGVLVFTEMNQDLRDALAEGLRERGYEEGRNLRVEWRAANGSRERAEAIAAELVGMKVDVIVASLTPAVQAAQKATRTIPIVMAPAGDPLKQGLVASLGRPGGNTTGVAGVELSGKRVELLQEVIPKLKRVSLLLNRDDPSFAKVLTDGTKAVGARLGIDVDVRLVGGADEFETAFAGMAKARTGAVIVQPSLLGPAGRVRQVAALGLRYRLPSMTQSPAFVEAGGLISYGTSFRQQYRQSAGFVARILKGESPGTMAVEQGTVFDLAINEKTAKALGLKIPPSIRLRATRIVE
jgi:putative ABC transport system substrate-binding protein